MGDKAGGDVAQPSRPETQVSRAALQQARTDIAGRLRERRAEIEQAVLVRASALLEAQEGLDPQFLEGQRAAVAAAVDHGIVAIELGEERAPAVPAIFHAHARLTARSGISLDTMLRRYFAGYTLLGDFLVREAEACGVQGPTLQCVMRGMTTVFERLLSTITEEYMREAEGRVSTSEERTAARVRALLAGELIDTAEFGYDFAAWHLGALVVGRGTTSALRDLATALDRRLLSVCGDEGATWAWLGGRRRVRSAEFEQIRNFDWPEGTSIALGEPGRGLAGWRRSHHQARAVLPIVLRGPSAQVRYADAALLASMLQDELLADSLRELYLEPLEAERDGGEALRETLRAYFAADRNASSAAAALGVSRRTVANRLRTIEALLDRSLSTAGAEVEAALRLYDLDAAAATAETPSSHA